MTSVVANPSLLDIAQQYGASGLDIRARIQGLSPGMLMHDALAMQRSEAGAREHSASGKRTKFIPSAEQEAEWGAYRLPSGALCLPAKNLFRSFVEAAKAFNAPKQRASLRGAAASGIRIDSIACPLLDPYTSEPITTYQIDVQRANVQRQAIQRARPLVPEWMAEVTFVVDQDAIATTVFAQILGYAGSRIGVCDLRPEKGGPYGRWVVTELEEVS